MEIYNISQKEYIARRPATSHEMLKEEQMYHFEIQTDNF